jgi:hypothetical protein
MTEKELIALPEKLDQDTSILQICGSTRYELVWIVKQFQVHSEAIRVYVQIA